MSRGGAKRLYRQPGVVVAIIGAGALIIAAVIQRCPGNRCTTQLKAFGTQMNFTPGSTAFLAPGTGVDPREGAVQIPVKNQWTLTNLQCVNASRQGIGADHDVIVIGRLGSCGSQNDTAFQCRIPGTQNSNSTCDETDRLIVPPGQCVDFKIQVGDHVEADALVNCSVEITECFSS